MPVWSRSRSVEPLGLQVDSEQHLVSPGGVRRRVDVYIVDVGIGSLRLPGIELVADEYGADVIVGRNVLNRLMVVLDGPRETIEIPE